jgi:hypothetical protein
MDITAVFTESYQPSSVVVLGRLCSQIPSWGSWNTWKSFRTQNAICQHKDQCLTLLQRGFQDQCNFYVPKNLYRDLGRPSGVKLFDGDFDMPVDGIEDIIAMHLAQQVSDVVLLFGVQLFLPQQIDDPEKKRKTLNRHGLIYNLIRSDPEKQWVSVDATTPIDKKYQDLPNFGSDTLDNVSELVENLLQADQ